LTNPQAINGFLNNTQQVLKAAQSIGPMIQQYAPIVRNLPAMWKLYKGLKEATAESESTEHESDTQEEITNLKINTENKSPKRVKNRKKSAKKKTVSSVKPVRKKESVPKLYIE
jgi:YqfQ-like protein